MLSIFSKVYKFYSIFSFSRKHQGVNNNRWVYHVRQNEFCIALDYKKHKRKNRFYNDHEQKLNVT